MSGRSKLQAEMRFVSTRHRLAVFTLFSLSKRAAQTLGCQEGLPIDAADLDLRGAYGSGFAIRFIIKGSAVEINAITTHNV